MAVDMSTNPSRDPRERNDGPPLWSTALAGLGGILILGFLIYAVYTGDLESLETPWIAGGVLGAVLFGGWLYVERDNLRRLAATQLSLIHISSPRDGTKSRMPSSA